MATQSLEDVYNELDQKVRKYLALSGNCAQTTFLSIQEQFEFNGDAIVKALTPLPGIALRGETCGAVIGGLMAIGMVYGRDKKNLDDWQAYLDSLPPARKFCRSFEKQLGSTMCGDIIEAEFGKRYNLANQADALEWMQCGALEKCGGVIERGVHIVAEIIVNRK